MTDRSVPFFSYPDLFGRYAEEYLEMVKSVGCRGAYILQEDLARFERNLAAFLGAKHTLGVGNATDGLHFALRAAGLCPGDEVILSSHTMVATAAAVHFAGGVPIPVECGADHLIDPDAVASAVSPRTRFIMPTQLNGRTCRMDRLQAVADRHGLLIVEDAAQALGSRFQGRAAGTFGIAAAISFYPAKVLGCFGDGGAVVTQDDQVREKLLVRSRQRFRCGSERQDGGCASEADVLNLFGAVGVVANLGGNELVVLGFHRHRSFDGRLPLLNHDLVAG